MTADNKPFDLTGRTAVVTGGGGILGTGFCRVLAAHGARVAVLDVNLQAADEAVQAIRRAYPAAELQAYACNVGDPGQVQQTVDQIVARLEKENGKSSALLQGIIESTPFQKRRIPGMNPGGKVAQVSKPAVGPISKSAHGGLRAGTSPQPSGLQAETKSQP